MDWFSIHTSWLYSETQELSNSSIYREHYQFIDKTLISTGTILVHKEKTAYYPILIVYPEATPYMPPIIYMLDHDLEENIAQVYSTLSIDEIKERIQDNKKFFNRRHQNEDGSICFIETGDLHSENPEIFSIKDIIKRVRIWLSGKIPKDSREVELFHHFSNRTYEIQYLLPDLFFESEIIKGKYYSGLSTVIPANFFPDGITKKTYMGTLIFGDSKGGITLPPKEYINKKLILFTSTPNIEDLIAHRKKVEIQKEIEIGNLIEGFWWDILEEPPPFSSVNELAKHIGNGHENNGINELIETLKDLILDLHDTIHIGIRFPGRLRDKEWQMFRLKKGSRPIIIETTTEELKNRLIDYSIEAVNHEYFTEEDFHRRNRGRAERTILKNIAISIIGCGAIGSETADAFNKAGIGRILLVDKDDMRAQNTMRHCLGIDSICIPKAIGMIKYLGIHNPFVDHDVPNKIKINILHNKVKNYLPEGTIGISTIADDNIEAYLNEQAVSENRTIFYCRALRGGKAARIFRVIPYEDACKQCLALYSGENNPVFINIEEDDNLPEITNECNNPIRPASAADLKIIAGIFSRIVIDYLHGNNTDKNHWVWSTESLEKIKLDDSYDAITRSSHIPPHPKCPTCQKLKDKRVSITNEAYVSLKKEAAHSKDIETGGVLIGYKSEDGEYVILKVTGPGPKAVRSKTVFEKDEEYCQKELESAFKELGDKGLYVGEWHYHAIGNNQPSGLDIKSLTEIATQKEYRIDKPIMIIISQTLECAITIHDKNGRCVQIPLEIINAK